LHTAGTDLLEEYLNINYALACTVYEQ
jgi:hypothetical protein